MRSCILTYLVPVVLLAVVVGAIVYVQRPATWKREQPLLDPIRVASVEQGVLMLADGRELRPAGVQRSPHVSQEEYDVVLQIVVAQGVVVDRMVGASHAMMIAEPRYWNWCGTCQRRRGSLGKYEQAPLSELLVLSGFAIPTEDTTGLTPRDIWRLHGCEQLRYSAEPDGYSESRVSLGYGGHAYSYMNELDMFIETITESPSP